MRIESDLPCTHIVSIDKKRPVTSQASANDDSFRCWDRAQKASRLSLKHDGQVYESSPKLPCLSRIWFPEPYDFQFGDSAQDGVFEFKQNRIVWAEVLRYLQLLKGFL